MAELGDRDILDEEAFRRAELGAVLLMTAVGVPLIWMGEEFGEYKYKTQSQAKVDWTLLAGEQNQGLFAYYKGLIALRKQNHALYTESIHFFHEHLEAKVLAYTRWNEEGSRIVVVANFSEQFLAGYAISDFPEDGTWHEWTGDYDVNSGNQSLMTDLGPYEAKVFVWQ
jgi:1,4-alpha-glucan branching enzyme